MKSECKGNSGFEVIRIGILKIKKYAYKSIANIQTDGRTDGILKEGIGCSKLTYNLKTYEELFVLYS